MTKEQRKAINLIRNYLNKDFTDEYILENFDLAIEQLIDNAKNISNKKTTGVKSMSEGNQSITFESGAEAWTITEDIKLLLPTPYARLF
ncbi:hypothetical protein HAHI6034_05015 [Hathewaya histolytica]|uniref:Phage gp6-like head-tail connector protein n=1 Tax=Hathewaya histolytica TaxID=1498 RepID=A0A4V6KCM4_HATHI|nr:hypothetical protein [Hathewaya histolytica]VTQ86967.1 Uncharacterised protein [Hathewaya histolytica]